MRGSGFATARDLARLYKSRTPLLETARTRLEQATQDALQGVPHVDRIVYRIKDRRSFVEKALDPENDPPYQHPLREIEDQLGGRVIVFFLTDLGVVRERLKGTFTEVEWSRRQPDRDEEFGYESDHLICVLPPQVKTDAWGDHVDMPTTFELQLRTVFMHAYAEPQHDLAYKAAHELPKGVRRELAWIAASAWGADHAYERVMRAYRKGSA